jgi:hypothetical protein
MKVTTRLDAGINDLAPDDLPISTIEILGTLTLGTAFVLTALDPMIGVVLLNVFVVAYVTVRTLLHNAER